MEAQLSIIFRLTSRWKALVLLDEADVFVQERSLNHNMNGQISVFLRKLEYYQGVMFLTTNRVKTFDNAFQSRITMAFKYDSLSLRTKRTVWERFLMKATTKYGPAVCKPKELDMLAHKILNGRQVSSISICCRRDSAHGGLEDQECDRSGIRISDSRKGKGIDATYFGSRGGK